MKLVVLAGAKQGSTVPIKKSSFVIGRGKDCALRAGSDAISRRHCELLRGESGVTVRDLGSRNGTYVNDEKIEGTRTLAHGDTLRIGPLEFRFEFEGELKKAKAPKVKTVADAVARAAQKKGSTSDDFGEDDISEWLLGDVATGESPGIGETLSMRSSETRINAAGDAETKELAPAETAENTEEAATAESADQPEDGKGKKEPGKLPFRPDAPKAKDSREAAAQVLRDMARRR